MKNKQFPLKLTLIFLLTAFITNAFNVDSPIEIFDNGDPIKIIRKKSALFLYTSNKIDFDLNSSKLNSSTIYELSQIASKLIKSPNLKIEIGVHNDIRSGVEYSKSITEKRANSIKHFFVNYGIKAENLMVKGFGDTAIINKCTVFVKCTNAEHRVNRRVELKILNPEELIDYTLIYKKRKKN